jgi:predicted SnoaL-like aldol condensation-catalyzing enzyme
MAGIIGQRCVINQNNPDSIKSYSLEIEYFTNSIAVFISRRCYTDFFTDFTQKNPREICALIRVKSARNKIPSKVFF